MTTMKTMLACLAGLTVAAGMAVAQGEGGERPRGRRQGGQGPGEFQGGQGGDSQGQRPPPFMKPPLIAALDANDDGVIDEKEIDQAVASLRKLDKNGDGKLDRQELMPVRPTMGPSGGDDSQGGQQGERSRRGQGGRGFGGGNPPPPPDQQ